MWPLKHHFNPISMSVVQVTFYWKVNSGNLCGMLVIAFTPVIDTSEELI